MEFKLEEVFAGGDGLVDVELGVTEAVGSGLHGSGVVALFPYGLRGGAVDQREFAVGAGGVGFAGDVEAHDVASFGLALHSPDGGVAVVHIGNILVVSAEFVLFVGGDVLAFAAVFGEVDDFERGVLSVGEQHRLVGDVLRGLCVRESEGQEGGTKE